MYFIFSFWPLFVLGQVYDDFESGFGGTWEQFPENRWESSPDQALSGFYSLHHAFDNTTSGTDRISMETGRFDLNNNISWEFTIQHSYTPSSSNKWQVFLASDKSARETDGLNDLSGYIFGVNVTGSDDTLRLYAVIDGVLSLICATDVNYENDIGLSPFHLMIKRDAENGWEIFGSIPGNEFRSIGKSQKDNYYFPGLKNFMLSFSYTSSKDRLLWLDDVIIQAFFLVDSIPPEINNFKITGRKSIVLEMSEEIGNGILSEENFLLMPGNLSPENIIKNGKILKCNFAYEFAQRTGYKLIAKNLEDQEGNILMIDSIEFFYYRAEKDDIIISEIMADPSPAVHLPEMEYLELYCRSEFPIALDSFILQTGKKEWRFPEYTVNPGEYLIITSGEKGLGILPLFTSSSVITNDGQQFFLKDAYEDIITAAEFFSGWYEDEFKSQGGWSLERIDTDNACGGKENWKVSGDNSGGTPGRQNSVSGTNTFNSVPYIDRLEYLNDSTIRLVFSKNVDSKSIPSPDSFSISDELLLADSLCFSEYFCGNLEIQFNGTFKKGLVYQLRVPDGIKDCTGNALVRSKEIQFGLPEKISLTDIIISEVMYSTLPGCPEFIELFNQSDQLLDLSDVRISVGPESGSGNPSIPLVTPVLFFPGDFLVLCRDKESLLNCHIVSDQSMVIEAADLPALPDEGACLEIVNRSLEPVDTYCYKPEDSFPMLSDLHGVSLERLLLNRNTGDQSYWHSASSISDFATPGRENSQSITNNVSQNTLEIVPEIFSPDNNGIDDILEIHYVINKEGFVGTVAVFDPSGRFVCFPGQNEILGTKGMFLWDGRDQYGRICNSGIYVIFAEFWNLKGERERFKKAVVLIRQ